MQHIHLITIALLLALTIKFGPPIKLEVVCDRSFCRPQSTMLVKAHSYCQTVRPFIQALTLASSLTPTSFLQTAPQRMPFL